MKYQTINFLFAYVLGLISVISPKHLPQYLQMTKSFDMDLDSYEIVNKTVTENSFDFLLQYGRNSLSKTRATAEFVTFKIFFISKDTIQFVFKPTNDTRFELPMHEPFPHHKYEQNLKTDLNSINLNYDFEIVIKEMPFSFTLLRKETKEIVFSTINNDIIFRRNYSQITTNIPSENLFGLGERTTNFKLKSGIYTLYNKDLYGVLEDGSGKGKNRYGSHPMYLMRERNKGYYHISYLRNAFPMDVIVNHEKGLLKYKILGGVLDFTFFFGDNNPETVIKKYHAFLGGYALPPFFAMGFHQCRWGYRNLSMIEDVLAKYDQNKLPLDTIWMDIDYMISKMPYTVDETRYNLTEFRNMLNTYKKKFIMISEPTIGIKWPLFTYLKKAINLDIFIKNSKGRNLLNKVWPGKSYFIDYFNPKTEMFWKEAHFDLHEKIEYSGVWLDMNEIATFSKGQIDMQEHVLSCNDQTKYSFLPGKQPLEEATICPNAIHYKNMKHVQVHNYYPVQQSMLTYKMLEELYPDQYPFILTRANAPGTGKYAAKWSGDNYGTFEWYKFSVAEIFNYNLFGIPMSGSDICGFGYNTPELLCSKWYQMGSLFPFARSHSHIDYYRKEPYAMGRLLLETTRKSLNFRYSILKYYYSVFMLNKNVGTIFRPLFFEFYDDARALDDVIIDNYFLIGSSLLTIPNFHNNTDTFTSKGYFPKGDWFSLRDNSKVDKDPLLGEFKEVETRMYEMTATYLRSGKIIFTNDITNVANTFDLDNVFSILIPFGEDSTNGTYIATGKIPALRDYHSRTQVEACIEKDCFISINSNYTRSNNGLQINFSKPNYTDADYKSIYINKFIIYSGQAMNVSEIDLSNSNLDQFITKDQDFQKFKYDVVVVNSNCLLIKINGIIEVSKDQDVNIFIKFK